MTKISTIYKQHIDCIPYSTDLKIVYLEHIIILDKMQ